MMKKTIFISLICVAFSLISHSEIRKGNQAASSICKFQEEHICVTAKDYIIDGMIAIWDAIENEDWNKHNSSIGKINDLYGGTSATITQYGQLKNTYVKCNGNGSYYQPSLTIPGRWSTAPFYEIVIELPNIYATKSMGICAGRYNGLFWLLENRIGVADYIGQSKATIPITFGFHTISVMYGDGIYIDGQLIDIEDFSWSNSGISDTRRIMDIEGKFFCLRKYNRKLSSDEILHNYEIDRLRFK